MMLKGHLQVKSLLIWDIIWKSKQVYIRVRYTDVLGLTSGKTPNEVAISKEACLCQFFAPLYKSKTIEGGIPDVRFPYITFSMVFSFVRSHCEVFCSLQLSHFPQEMGNDATTRSPTLNFFAPGPTLSTTPQNSWPKTSPFCN